MPGSQPDRAEYLDELAYAYEKLGRLEPAADNRAATGLHRRCLVPADQYPRALQTWPSFAEDYQHGPYQSYCERLELLLRDVKAQGVKRLGLTPITIDEYLAWCTEHDRDPEESETRASYATTLIEHGIAQPWPPERNDPCWCGSERKYKKCCLHAR